MAIALIFSWILLIAMLVVIVSDITRYIIPNSLNGALLLVYAFAAYMLGLPFEMALLAAGLALLVGLGIFTLGLMGGGDVKLLVVLLLWTGWSIASVQFLVWTAAIGGVLAILVLILRAAIYAVYTPSDKRNLPRILTRKQPIPYGIAIAGAFILMLGNGGIAGLPSPF